MTIEEKKAYSKRLGKLQICYLDALLRIRDNNTEENLQDAFRYSTEIDCLKKMLSILGYTATQKDFAWKITEKGF